MCLAIPGKIISIENQVDEVFRFAKVSFDGIVKQVNLAMVPEAKIGDYVLVHVGSAISIVDEEEAKQTMDILYKMDELDGLENTDKLDE
jgi:hydrogenase expression/formation protein HypC